jgi:hypothetical protein
MTTAPSFPDYPAFLAALKDRIVRARVSAARAVNHELVLLYWDIGRGILEKQQTAGWGDAVVEQLASDLRAEFPDIRGFAPRSVWNMRRLFQAYGTADILPQAVAEREPDVADVHKSGCALAEGNEHNLETALEKLRHAVAGIPWGHHSQFFCGMPPVGRVIRAGQINLDKRDRPLYGHAGPTPLR